MPNTRPAFLQRLFRASSDPREELRPLWHRIVAITRQPEWYAECGVADTVPGRFDMITAVLSLVVLRMENERHLQEASSHLIELFVEDMDGQLREFGINDVVVGKHMGRLMSTLGGRMGAYRDGLAADDARAMADAVRRNITLTDDALAARLADRLTDMAEALRATDDADLLAGRI